MPASGNAAARLGGALVLALLAAYGTNEVLRRPRAGAVLLIVGIVGAAVLAPPGRRQFVLSYGLGMSAAIAAVLLLLRALARDAHRPLEVHDRNMMLVRVAIVIVGGVATFVLRRRMRLSNHGAPYSDAPG